jgi:eukaryotic-like serine/threonine-protein kinase
LGAILYEMLTGKRAFQKPTSADTMSAILNEDPLGISQVAPNIPLALQRVAHRCLEKNPEQRFQSASDLAFALQALSDSGSSTSSVVQPNTRATGIWLSVSLAVVAVLVSGALLWFSRAGRVARSQWMQLTNLPDAATQPALSPDGRMLAFIRGPNTFIGQGELYVKMLPDGEPFQVTHDGSRKMGPVFSPDGSRIAYTVLGNRDTWDTWVVPVLGGKPELWLTNAAGLVWIDAHRVLFSEIKRGQHMVISTSLESRAETRDVYVPPNEDAMAHRSYISPDGSPRTAAVAPALFLGRRTRRAGHDHHAWPAQRKRHRRLHREHRDEGWHCAV